MKQKPIDSYTILRENSCNKYFMLSCILRTLLSKEYKYDDTLKQKQTQIITHTVDCT
jgi:hypothetical protein